MELTEMIVVLMAVSSPAIIVFLLIRYKAKKLEVLQDLIRSDKPLNPELLALFDKGSSANADLRQGIFYCAVGIALMIILGMEVLGNPPKVALLGVLPLSIGIGYFILMFLSRDGGDPPNALRDPHL